MLEFIQIYFGPELKTLLNEFEVDLEDVMYFIANQVDPFLCKRSGISFTCDKARMSVEYY